MSEIVIAAEQLSKQYRIGVAQPRYKALRDTIAQGLVALSSVLTRGKKQTESARFWALEDISFEIRWGDVVGVIGRNGAGKSTLLKILSRITTPTRGRATIRGRAGSLLEVGSGFHPELTGRDNIYLNGAILGMRRGEINRKFDAIVDFAEIEKFLDTPVKHYSSGMYTRLAFAVAAHLEPEILLVDEVLAVGDAAFQKKCLGKMGEVAREGRTVLFVSHNLTAIATLCRSALWLHRGRLIAHGPAATILSEYLRPEGDGASFDAALFPDDSDFRLLRATLDQNGNGSGPFVTSAPLDVVLEYEVPRAVSGLRLGVDVMTIDGITLWRSFDDDMLGRGVHKRAAGTYRAVCRLPENLFFPRQYIISLSVGIQATRWITFGQIQQTVEFYNVNGVGSAYADEHYRAGLLMPGLDWTTDKTDYEPEHALSGSNGSHEY
jgi:lipopolysaccharide transport system ATP-binding protein